jgi:hypothetical protein
MKSTSLQSYKIKDVWVNWWARNKPSPLAIGKGFEFFQLLVVAEMQNF